MSGSSTQDIVLGTLLFIAPFGFLILAVLGWSKANERWDGKTGPAGSDDW